MIFSRNVENSGNVESQCCATCYRCSASGVVRGVRQLALIDLLLQDFPIERELDAVECPLPSWASTHVVPCLDEARASFEIECIFFSLSNENL